MAFIWANSKEPSSEKVSTPPASITLAFPRRMQSTALSTEDAAVAHAATCGLIGPEEDISNIFIHAAGVFMNDSCNISDSTVRSPVNRSRKLFLKAQPPPIPDPKEEPTSET